jgi:3-methyladenine DNA glycosylase AlkD
MPTKLQERRAKPTSTTQVSLTEALAWLEQHGTEKTRAGMSGYGIVAPKAFGVTMADIKQLGKRIGQQHALALALALWDTGWYEARLLTAFVGDPEQLTPAQMERWCREFDNWAVCDTLCFHLFDRSPHAFAKVGAWARRRDEFVRRAAFALLARPGPARSGQRRRALRGVLALDRARRERRA